MATIFEGLIAKESFSSRVNVRVATTTDMDNVGNGTWVVTSQTLTAGSAGLTTIDGIQLADGDRVLVKNQVNAVRNGIYEASATDAGSPTVLSRTADLELGNNASGTFVFMMEGTTNEQSGWICINTLAVDIVETDPLTFRQFDTIGTLRVGRGGTGATSFTNNQIVLGQGTNPLTTITTANNSVLVTNGSGVPSWTTILPNTLQVSFRDDLFTIYDNVVNTKTFHFEVSPAAPATNVVATIFPTSDTITGIASTQTLTNKTITSGRYNQLNDTNGNTMVVFTPTASAVNGFTMTNAAAGGTPSIAVTGTDANISMNLLAKGTGKYNFQGTSAAPTEIRLFEDTDNGSNYIGIDVPAAVTANITYTLPGTDGSSGDYIVTDGSGNLSFVTPLAGRIAYHIVTEEVVANTPNYVTIGYFAWAHTRYSTYTMGTLIYEVAVSNRNLDLRLRNTTAGSDIVTDLGVSTSGWRVITAGFTNPTANARQELQVKKSANGGSSPKLFSVQLEWRPS